MTNPFLAILSDVVIQSLTTNLFWLTTILTLIIVFRKELRSLFNSVTSAKVAGASFEFKDPQRTAEYHVLLSSIFFEALSKPDAAEQIVPALSRSSADQLGRFTLKYAKEKPPEEIDIELLKNVAYILARFGMTPDAISFYDVLLKQRPNDANVLHYKALAYLNGGANSGSEHEIRESVKLYEQLVKDYPNQIVYRLNLASGEGMLGMADAGLADLAKADELGARIMFPALDFLGWTGIQALHNARPDEFDKMFPAS